MGKSLLCVTEDALTRQTVVDNSALLDPLVKEVGVVAAIHMHAAALVRPACMCM